VELLFRELQADEMERPPTQRDQFNNDDVALAEALVREAFQNSLDAALGQVHITIGFHAPGGADIEWFRQVMHEAELRERLAACEIDVGNLDFGAPRLLVIEDFGTTGLTGSWETKDDGSFSDFWRRMGKSHKAGRQLGRWGLGKLVFSSASRVRCFFGLTLRHDDPDNALLMGQAVLTHHRLPRDGKDYDSHGFFAIRRPDERFQLPETRRDFLERYRTVCGVTRTAEPGLSIIVPFVDEAIRTGKIVEFILRNYFFPILTGKLTAEVDGTRIDAQTFNQVASSAGGEQFSAGGLASFILEMNDARRNGLLAELPAAWTNGLSSAMPTEQIAALREAFARDGRLVAVRAPVLLKRKDGTEVPSHVDLFLKRAEDGAGATLFVRDSITLPAEAARYFRARNCFAALVADDEGVAAFLGDAENPAHTSWSATAEKVTSGWRNPQARMAEVRSALQKLHDLLASAIDDLDLNALVDTFSVRGPDGSRRMQPRGSLVRPPVVPVNPPKPKSYRVVRRRGGFAVKAGPGLTPDGLPLRIRVRVAYDVLRGDPFARHSPFDFDLTGNALTVKSSGAAVAAEGAGSLAIDALTTDFEVEVEGFDPRRDLAIDPSRRT
jgi:hypothetical protein